MNAWQQFIQGFDFSPLWDILMYAIPALVCITLHELSHGLVAYALGDPTAKAAGRLTLNPIRHLDIIGFLMLVVAHVGWAKPVPVNMRNFENPKRGMALTALAGPLSNVLITCVCLFFYGFFLPVVIQGGAFALGCFRLLYYTAYLSLGLALFNLLPIPPLDGSKVLFALIPDESYGWLMRYERYGVIVLLLLGFTGVTGRYLSDAIQAAFGLLIPIAQWAGQLSISLFFA